MYLLPYDEVQDMFGKYELPLDTERYQLFERYMGMVIETNKTLNLTRITEPADVTQKHILDSVMIFRYIDTAGKAADVGTGAGFPGVPMKIYRQALDMTLLDSLNKRINFLKGVSADVVPLTCIHTRAEDAGRTMRESFDLVTARAVANFDVLCEYCLPLVAVGGTFASYKGPGEDIDTETAKRFGGEVTDVHEYSLPDGDRRRIILTRKIAECDKRYPRKKIK